MYELITLFFVVLLFIRNFALKMQMYKIIAYLANLGYRFKR